MCLYIQELSKVLGNADGECESAHLIIEKGAENVLQLPSFILSGHLSTQNKHIEYNDGYCCPQRNVL
jgi:hypothetical protein